MTNDGVLLNKQNDEHPHVYESFDGVLPEPTPETNTVDWTPVVLHHHSGINMDMKNSVFDEDKSLMIS